MAPLPEVHHHRSTTKVSHKPFKSRHATKGLIKDLTKGKIERHEKGSRKTPHQQIMSKIDRRNQAKQLRQNKHQENAAATSVFGGQNGAPRIVAVVPVCKDCDSNAAIQKLNQSVGADIEMPAEGPWRVRIERFAQNIIYLPVEQDVVSAMNACRAADFVLFLLSSNQEAGEEGEQLIRAVEGQGISNVLTMVQNLQSIQPAKKQPQVVASLKSYITHFFPTQDKVHSLDSDRECANVVRSLCTTAPKGIIWREDRSWMLVENVQSSDATGESHDCGEVVITGVVRGKGLKPNRLIQVGDWGQFQIEKITDATLPMAKKRKADEMTVDIEDGGAKILGAPDEDQDDLDELAPYDETMEDADEAPISEVASERKGVLLDDHHYYSEEDNSMPPPPRKLPKGTSSYQAAWFLGDMSDSYSSDDSQDHVDEEGDLSMDPPSLPLDEPTITAQPDPTETTPSEYPQSETFADPSPADEAHDLEAYRTSRKLSAAEDREFPDEIELHPTVLARERLSRYRGLRSLKTSPWDTTEDKPHEPQDYDRLLQIPDFRSARKRAANEALVGGIPPGRRVAIHLRNVPPSLLHSHTSTPPPPPPLAAFSLLRHEHKRSVIHTTIHLPSSPPSALPSKSPLLCQIGPRRFLIHPLFSEHSHTPNNVHKYLRFLHPGHTAVASFIAPVTWSSSTPVLYFTLPPIAPHHHQQKSPTLLATGSLLPPTPSRVLAKCIVLTGAPFKVHKKLVTVRYMFFNKEDVEWFKALRLWTKRGRQGFIRESLGTHGYFKAVFDGRVGMQESVGVSLWKRVWPRGAEAWRGDLGGGGEEDEEVPMEMGDAVV
ncbi:MAG: hypothetical protein LQ338_007175 [Usnochroma carphineum]|nr:MAG: hypothetical protein LQ338_007175 [Usnochroma carphineum]